DELNILGLPASPPFDLEGAGGGTCLVWYASINGTLTGVEVGNNVSDIEGCYALSNPITVIREGVNGGDLSTTDGLTELTICAGDGNSDAFDVVVENSEGENAAWVITDDSGNILALPPAPPFDLEGAGPGTCLVWYLRYNGDITGAEVGNNAADIEGCFDLSNPIAVVREYVESASIATTDNETEITICAGDGVSDAFDVTVDGGVGMTSAWIITDDQLNILGLPAAPPFDLEGAGGGTCLVWYASINGTLTGVEVGNNVSDIEGCYALSNPITVIREGVNGGDLSTTDGLTELTICAGDGNSDAFDVMVENSEGENAAWVITDDSGNILALPPAPPFDLEGAGPGTCLVWYLRYNGDISGAEVGNNAADIEGCYDLSNPIVVIREYVESASIATTDEQTEITICAGDGVSDAFDVMVDGGAGMTSAWIITDDQLNILGLPAAPPFDLEGAGGGTCLVWYASINGTLTGVEVGNNVSEIEGCYALSNPITVIREGVNGGDIETTGGMTELTICAGDGNSDAFDVTLTNEEGESSAWVITDDSGNILALPPSPPFDLDGA
ncbi:MAG: hypothetical protein AAGK97_11025, partial [Bacteroidota bacterium]